MSQSSTVYIVLRRAILDCELPPDSQLVISSLKARFGFGWTPLREALPRLEAEKLVRFEPNKGYRVAPVSVSGLKDLQIARTAIETTLLERSLKRGDDAWEANLVAAHHLLAQNPAPPPGSVSSGSLAWERHHGGFHKALLAAADAPWLDLLADQTADQLHRHHRHMLNGHDVAERLKGPDRKELKMIFGRTLGLSHHTALMNAAISRDIALALDLLREHIGFSLAVYEALWPAREIQPG